MPISDFNLPQLPDVAPGAGTLLAQLRAIVRSVRKLWPAGYGGVAGEAIALRDAVAFDVTTGKLYKADSNGANGRWNMVGFAAAAAAVDQPLAFVGQGPVDFPHAHAAGTPLYLSETPGAVSATPGATPRLVAMAMPSGVVFARCASSWAAS